MCKLDPEKVVYQISKKIIEGFLSEILELWSAKHSIVDLFISHHLRNRFLAPANLLIDLRSVLRKHLLLIIIQILK